MHSPQTHRILICGLGSIGQRHLNNLLHLGYRDIILYRVRNAPLKGLQEDFPTYNNLEDAIQQGPTVAFICNPSSLHVPTAIRCADAGCHLFIEKPLGHSWEGVAALGELLQANRKHAMVGYMMRFHPCISLAKQWLDAGQIGRPLYARTQWGEYLPGWHPWEAYQSSYAAQQRLGGGPALSLSHDIDLLLWFFGRVSSVAGMASNVSSLDVDTEHGIDLLLRFQTGMTAAAHLDFFQRPPARTIDVVGELGRFHFDYYQSRLDLFMGDNRSPVQSLDVHDTFDRNQMFLDELKAFFRAIDQDEDPEPGLEAGINAMEVALRSLGGQ